MSWMKQPKVHPLRFGHRFGSRYGHFIDTDFFLGRDPREGNLLAPDKKSIPANVKEYDTFFELEIAVPGYKREDIFVHAEGDELAVFGEREINVDAHDRYILKEHHMDGFERIFELDKFTDKDNITATLDNGVLRIVLHHNPEVIKGNPRYIQVD